MSNQIQGSIIGPIVVIFSPCGLSVEQRKTLHGPAFTCSAWGKIDRHDSIAHLARIGIRPTSDLTSRIGHAVMIDVAAWSRSLLEQMAQWEVDDQIDPASPLISMTDGDTPFPTWENGLVDLWDDEPAAHPVAALAHGLTKHVQRRIWSAQAAIILPFVDRIRRGIIQRHRIRLDQYVSPQTPFKRFVNAREIIKSTPDDLEFFEIMELLDGTLSRREKHLIKFAKYARDCGAHMKLLNSPFVHQLSEHFEVNRHLLVGDIPQRV